LLLFRLAYQSPRAHGHLFGGGINRFDNIVIARTATDIAIHMGTNVSLAWHGMIVHKVDCAHHHASRAKSALKAMMLTKGGLHGVQVITIGNTFDRRDIGTIGL
jgi:hypothetical protein